MGKRSLAVAAAMLVLITPMAALGARADTGSGNITPVVLQGSTTRLGGGDWVAVHAGSTNFGVVYGTPSNPNAVYIFADYRRYIAGVDFYDAQGNYLRTKGIPVEAIFAQSFDKLIEFRDMNGDDRFDMRRWDGNLTTSDMPVKGLSLNRAWTLSGLTNETVNGILNVTFTLSISDVPYTWVWSPVLRRPIAAPESTGTVSKVAFTFHISVGVENATARVPWFKVTITAGDERRVTNRTSLGWREFEGQKVNMTVKYDHEIDGWDFAHADSALLLETRMLFGYAVPKELVERYRLGAGSRAIAGGELSGHEIGDDERSMPQEPSLIAPSGTKGTITFADDWERVGRFTWVSDVRIDDTETEDMYFQVHGGGPMSFTYDRTVIAGLGILGAFVYPQGSSIVHDPAFDAASYEFGVPTITNLSPFGVLFLQLIVIAVAVTLAVVLKLRRKGQQ